MDDLLRDFLTESSENLLRLDQEIVEMEKRPEDLELLKSIFRTIHTIKGTCGFLGLVRLESVAHAAENVLGLLRDGRLPATPEVVSDVLAAVDVIRAILEGLETAEAEPPGDDTALIARLDRWVAGEPQEVVDAEALFAAAAAPTDRPPERAGEAEPARPRARRARRASAPRPASAPPAPPTAPAAAAPEGDRVERASVADSSLRVGVEILDLLMNLAGELVLTRNQLVQLAQEDGASRYAMPLQHLNRVTSELQEAVMKTRMQPIGNAWGKLPRLVRDLAQASGKRIELEMTGAETELDRQILQAIQDPLTHMIRNSADHGIEPPAVRRAAGKPEKGTIRLEAFHEGGQIIIEIRDDGKGLDVEAIRAKAVQQGLVRPEVADGLPESQIFRFIFEPGFSTAERITNVSGRGVGMDVVRSNIERIGGAIELASVRGRGTTLRIKIPLTLAILSALIVGAGGESFAIPQIGVLELVRLNAENRVLLEEVNGTEFFRLRQTLLPIVRLHDTLCLDPGSEGQASIVVCQVGAHRFGLLVDEIFDTHEIVVKRIGRAVKGIRFYSGTTILGDGRVIMILDVPSIATASHVVENAEHSAAHGTVAAEQAEDARMPLVVFSSDGATRQAVPLALVSRLEKIPVASIEHADGRWLVQYRGVLLPLAPASPALDVRAGTERPVIVFSDGDRCMGLAVEEIHDIVAEQVQVQLESRTPGLIGTAVVAGRSTEIMDINAFLRSVDPDWFAARRRTETRRRVLLVDDSPFFLNVIGPALRSAGFEVVMASDGQEALTRLEQGERYDVVVSDIDMPRVDGFEFARRVAENPLWGDLPLLALTGRSTEEDRARCLQLGFRDFLRKFDRDTLIAAIEGATAHQEGARA